MPGWKGTLPTLRAATDPNAAGGDYFGPSGFKEIRGFPTRVGMSRAARDEASSARLWDLARSWSATSTGSLRAPS